MSIQSHSSRVIRSCLRSSSSSSTPLRHVAAMHSLKPHEGYVTGASGRQYSRHWVGFVKAFAGWMGYSNRTSAGIRMASQAYDQSALRTEEEAHFLHNECQLPKSYQTWFTITCLHLWLLSTRLRALQPPTGQIYLQELTTQAFLDFEIRLRAQPYNISKNTLVKRYMNDLLSQHSGFVIALDTSIIGGDESDCQLAATIWRNVWGSQWGGGVGGVDGVFATSTPDLIDLGSQQQQQPPQMEDDDLVDPDARFAEQLERFVIYVRKEVERLGKLSDEVVIRGDSEVVAFGKL